MKLRQLFAISFFACCAHFNTNADNTSTSKQEVWRNAPPLPYAVQEIYPAVYQEHIVVAGGLSPDVDENDIGVSDRVVAFNLNSQQWVEAPKLPEPRHHPMVVVVNDRLLSFGGFVIGKNGAWRNTVDVLELTLSSSLPNTNKLEHGEWKKIAEMPTPLAETLSAVHDGKVHLVGGRTPKNLAANSRWIEQTDVDFHHIFDPKTLTWAKGAPLPTARNSACSVKLNGQMHTIGGRTVSGGNLAKHEVYHFERQQWQSLAPLPAAQGGLACVVSHGRIYVFGGEYFDNGGGVYADVWEYRPQSESRSESWSSVSKMPNPRHGLGAVTADEKIYVLAGALQAGGNQTSAAMTVFSASELVVD